MNQERRDPDSEGERLADRTKEFFADIASDFLRRPAEKLARHFAGRMAQFLIAITFFCVAIVFLLVALVMILDTYEMPEYVAYLSVGTLALILGGIMMMRAPAK